MSDIPQSVKVLQYSDELTKIILLRNNICFLPPSHQSISRRNRRVPIILHSPQWKTGRHIRAALGEHASPLVPIFASALRTSMGRCVEGGNIPIGVDTPWQLRLLEQRDPFLSQFLVLRLAVLP